MSVRLFARLASTKTSLLRLLFLLQVPPILGCFSTPPRISFCGGTFWCAVAAHCWCEHTKPTPTTNSAVGLARLVSEVSNLNAFFVHTGSHLALRSPSQAPVPARPRPPRVLRHPPPSPPSPTNSSSLSPTAPRLEAKAIPTARAALTIITPTLRSEASRRSASSSAKPLDKLGTPHLLSRISSLATARGWNE